MRVRFSIHGLILRLELLLAYLWTLIPDAHCEGCPPPDIPAWVWPAIEWVTDLLVRLHALCGC